MTTIAIDGLSEEEFRRSIENRLREGQPEVAAARLRALLEPYAGEGHLLPERFLAVTAADLSLAGWDKLAAAIRRHERFGFPVTALSIAFGWPGEQAPVPDAQGRLRPHLETGYYTDDAFPFSRSSREDLLEGYSYHGCTWAADCEAVDAALTLEGIDDLHGALAALEARLLASEEPDEDGIRAGSLGACLLSVLLYQAVGDHIANRGLPRLLCVMAGSNGVYPYFDAPVAGMPEEICRKAEEPEAEARDSAIPGPRYSSLTMDRIPAGRKRAALVLDETETETATRLAKLRGLGHVDTGASWRDSQAAPGIPGFPELDPPTGPLLAKKRTAKAWDFRDMLGPREPKGVAPPAPPPGAPPPPLSSPPAPPVSLSPPAPPPPLEQPPARPEPELAENPGDPRSPGSALREPDLEARLRALIARPIARPPGRAEAPPPQAGVQPEPVSLAEVPVPPSSPSPPSPPPGPLPSPLEARRAPSAPAPSAMRARLVVTDAPPPPAGLRERLKAFWRLLSKRAG